MVNLLCTFVHPITADTLKASFEQSVTVSASGKALHSDFFLLMLQLK